MTKKGLVTDAVFKTYQQVVSRMAVLSNDLANIDGNLSVDVEISSRPCIISVRLFRWNEKDEIVSCDHYDWFYDHWDAEQTREKLFAKIDEWEATYGME